VDVVFGIAILHHLDLRRVVAETHRILAPGGRGIFQEPVRNSKVIRAVRAMIPYRAPDVSPFERPLTDGELRQFAASFRALRTRAFTLPHVSVATVVPALRRLIHPFHRIDGMALRAFPWLAPYAGIRVIELVK
jgi:SAM-dependent methyltransferase